MSGMENERAIVELFDTIDNVSNSNDENDKIINKVKNKIFFCFSSHFDRQKERKARKSMLNRYKAYISGFQELLLKQMLVLDRYVDKPNADIKAEVFFDLKKELVDYSIKALVLDITDMSEYLSADLTNIYSYVRSHDFLEIYHKSIKENELITNVPVEQNKSTVSDWKTIYYIAIEIEKQSRFYENIFSNYVARTQLGTDDEFFRKQSIFCTTDFRGRLSKSIFYQRKRLNLTQAQLAKRSGVDRTMIAKIEKVCQKPTLETAIKLLSALNLELAIYPALEKAN